MATCLLRNSKTVVVYSSSLRALALRMQSFSSNAKWGRSPLSVTEDNSKVDETSHTVWPDPNLGLLGPRDKRLPFPGNIGLGNQLASPELSSHQNQQSTSKGESELLTSQLPQERHINILAHFLNPEQGVAATSEDMITMPGVGDILECVAQDCPQLVRKDFAELFPGVDVRIGSFTVVTLCQKTINDMSAWNENVDMEREELMLYFVIAAEEICSQLKDLGFWADFIDPSSGRPYLGPYTNSTMFETDERYRHLGFKIEDLGCCKVISHRAWGTNVFVGCLFTNAPADSHHIKSIIERHNGKKFCHPDHE